MLLPCSNLGSIFKRQGACQLRASPSSAQNARFAVSHSPELQVLLDHSSSHNLEETAKIQQLSTAATQEGNGLTWALQPWRGRKRRGEEGIALTANQICQSADGYMSSLLRSGVFPTPSFHGSSRVSAPVMLGAYPRAWSCHLAQQQVYAATRGKGGWTAVTPSELPGLNT